MARVAGGRARVLVHSGIWRRRIADQVLPGFYRDHDYGRPCSQNRLHGAGGCSPVAARISSFFSTVDDFGVRA